MSEASTVTVSPPVRRGRFRRLFVPIFAIGVPLLLWASLKAIHKFEVLPEAIFPLTMLFQLSFLLGFFVLAIWFLGFSGAPIWSRLVAVLLAIGIGVAAYQTIRSVEFDGQMNPIVYFTWDPDQQLALTQHLETVGPAIGGADLTIAPTDSPTYRGPNGDGVAPDVTLADTWPENGPKVLWRHPVGGGHAGVAVAGNSAITLEQRGDDEVVVCYDRDSGKERWVYAYPARFHHTEPMGGDGPRTTPTIIDGSVISLGATGELVCLDGASGTKRWQVNILTDNGAKNLEWGLSASPLVIGNRVLVNAGVDPGNNTGHAVAAYDRETGSKLWAAGTHPAGYASPIRAVLDGVEQVVVFDAEGLGGYDLEAGNELWRFPWVTDMGMNSAQPLVVGDDRIFVSSEKANGCALVKIARGENGNWSATVVWKSRALSTRFANPVLYEGHIYGLTDGRLICVDVANGQRVWRDGNFGNGQIVIAGDKLVLSAENGDIALVAADPAGFEELARAELFPDRTWNVPALAGKQLFVRNHHEMAVLELP